MNYVIVKEGVYIHEVYGPYENQHAAESDARAYADADKDDYHKWYVCKITKKDGLGNSLRTFRKNTR